MAESMQVKKWGNSLAIILPKELIKKQNIKLNDKIFIHVVKAANLKPIFGIAERTKSGQKAKDEAKAGWN